VRVVAWGDSTCSGRPESGAPGWRSHSLPATSIMLFSGLFKRAIERGRSGASVDIDVVSCPVDVRNIFKEVSTAVTRLFCERGEADRGLENYADPF